MPSSRAFKAFFCSTIAYRPARVICRRYVGVTLYLIILSTSCTLMSFQRILEQSRSKHSLMMAKSTLVLLSHLLALVHCWCSVSYTLLQSVRRMQGLSATLASELCRRKPGSVASDHQHRTQSKIPSAVLAAMASPARALGTLRRCVWLLHIKKLTRDSWPWSNPGSVAKTSTPSGNSNQRC